MTPKMQFFSVNPPPTKHSLTGPMQDIVLPKGWTLHRPTGQQIDPSMYRDYVLLLGELLEIRQDGKRVGAIRPPTVQEFTAYHGADGRN
jgi:hypothetical protein